ncbi:MAG: ERCC4 domain-containing protein [Fuerstiella sp.]
MRNPFPATPKHQQCRVVIDSREQLPYDLAPLTVEVGALSTGDYALGGEFSGLVCVERKSLQDFVSSASTGRSRLDRELQRMLAYPTRCIAIEATYADIDAGNWRAKATPKAIRNSIASFISRGICVMMCDDRTGGQKFVGGLLWRVWLHEYRRIRQIARDLSVGDDELAITARELRGCGASVSQVARALGVTQQRVREFEQSPATEPVRG